MHFSDEESASYRNVTHRYHRLFGYPREEKLVNCMCRVRGADVWVYCADYSCCYWKGRVPCQGHVYLSVTFVSFYSFIMGVETMIKIKWADVLVSGWPYTGSNREHLFI
jgi:hypothetical protein